MMTTKSDVKRFTKNLISRNPDLALFGRMVFVTPVRHFLRFIYLDRTSDPDEFRIFWSAKTLCAPAQTLGLSFATQLFPRTTFRWDLNFENFEIELIDRIEFVALPELRKIDSFERFYKFINRENDIWATSENNIINKIYNDVADEYYSEAENICERLKRPLDDLPKPPEIQRRIDLVTKVLCPLVKARDRAAIARFLDVSEAQTVKNLKLEKYWERTKFPIGMEDHEL